MGAPSTDLLSEILGPVVGQHGLDLDQVHLSPAGRRRLLRVVVDKDGGVTLDDVALASHAVSTALDETDVMGGTAYTLEVTSPGVDRPLTEPRHWRRASGRLVKVRLRDGQETTGRIVTADDAALVLETAEAPTSVTRLPYADVRDGRVQVEFTRPVSEPVDGAEGEPWTST